MPIRLSRFEMPKRVVKDEDSATDTYAKFIAEPFEIGYGRTIGNSLRRVLLSSIEARDIEAWLGHTEDYGVNIPNFDNICAEHNRKWAHYVERHCSDPKRKKVLLTHRVENSLISGSEAAAALRYLNYAYNLAKPQPVIDANMLM